MIATPNPTPSPQAAAVPPGGSTPPSQRRSQFEPLFAASISGPEGIALDPNVLATNAALTLLFVFFFGLTAEIFNSTIDENRDEIEGWMHRLTHGPLRFLAPLAELDGRLDRLSESGRRGAFVHALVVLALIAFVYGFLSPDFGLNASSLILVAALVAGVGFVTYLSEGGTALLVRRRHGAPSTVRLYGTAVGVAIVCVLASRVVGFAPGLVYGFMASSVILTPLALGRREEASLVLVPALALLAVALVAWILLQPIQAATSTDGTWYMALVEAVLSTIFVAGLEGLLFNLLPLHFMDGAVVMRWSRIGWGLTFGTVMFLWWQLLLNRDAAYVNAFRHTSVDAVIGVLVVFMLTTGVTWTFFRLREHPEPETETEVEGEAQVEA